MDRDISVTFDDGKVIVQARGAVYVYPDTVAGRLDADETATLLRAEMRARERLGMLAVEVPR